MKKLLTIQSNLLILISLSTLFFELNVAMYDNIYFFTALMIFIVLFGVPHGSLDVLFASQAYGLSNYSKWFKFLIAYIAAASAIIFLWLQIPNVFFIGFLILSIIHFSEDLNIPDINLIKFTYGASIIVMPSLFYAAEVTHLYGMIVDINVAKKLVIVSQLLIYPITFLLTIQLSTKEISLRTKLEILSVLSIMITLHPIFAFTLYFCLMHSARHIVRSHFFLNEYTRTYFLEALILPTLSVIIVGSIIWFFTFTQSIETDLIRIIFIGLAALTVPHAWVLKKSNFSRWIHSR
jgi:Brp/Blh family beta-carotene 15,15'-monooxygenase